MSRIVQRPVTVTTTETGEPLTIIDGDSAYTVSHVIDWWMESGAWWDNELHRTMYRVQTTEWFVFDLQVTGGQWSIYRVWD